MIASFGQILRAAVFVTAAVAVSSVPALAAGLSMTVEPLVIELRINPGDTANVKVGVKNNGTEPERIVAQRMDWRTTVDGSIKIERAGAEGASSLSEYLRLSPAEAVLAPGEYREFALTLAVPASFSRQAAVYWGGFYIRALPAQGSTAVFGPAATVVVYNTIGTPPTHVKLTQLHVSQSSAETAKIDARMINDSIGYVRPTVRILVEQAGRVVHDLTENSPVLFAGSTRTLSKSIAGLRPGEYQLELTVDYGGGTLVQGSTKFTQR